MAFENNPYLYKQKPKVIKIAFAKSSNLLFSNPACGHCCYSQQSNKDSTWNVFSINTALQGYRVPIVKKRTRFSGQHCLEIEFQIIPFEI